MADICQRDEGALLTGPTHAVGLDFGTWASGFSVTKLGRSGEMTVGLHENWPGAYAPSAKTRTALLYDTEDTAKPVSWGSAAINRSLDLPGEGRERFVLLEKFKLHSLQVDGLFSGLAPLPGGITAYKAQVDYLRCMKDYVMQHLSSTQSAPGRIRIKWGLTVPAGMTQAGLARARRAAADAGLVDAPDSPLLTLCFEPEAAALAVRQRQPLAYSREGQRFMVVDMGGGTVDLTVHEVVRKVEGELGLSDATARECLPQGASAIDDRFLAHLSSKLGPQALQDFISDTRNSGDWQRLLFQEWETVKCRHGTPMPRGSVSVALPEALLWCASEDAQRDLEEEQGGRMDRLEIELATMNSFFDLGLDEIVTTARDMLARAPGTDTVLLVGGMSASKYVQQRLIRELSAPGVSVVCPTYGYAAVVEGAAWFARFPSSIVGRRANMTYSCECGARWREGAPDQVWLPHRGAYRTTKGFNTYVKRDQLLLVDKEVAHTFVPMFPRQTGVAFDLYATLAKSARYTTEPTMVKVGSVHLDIPPGAYDDPDTYSLTLYFRMGEAHISVRAVDDQQGKEVQATILYDSCDVDC